MKKAQKFESIFLKKEKVSRDAFTFYFDRRGIDFYSGQYLKLFLQIENPDDRGSSRYFTISSSPTDKDFVTITTRIIKSSFKLKLNSLNPGDKVNIFAPLGYFDFEPNSKDQNIFLAGGIGVTPFHSIFRFIDAKKIPTRITLLVSFQNRDEAVFYEELKEIESRNKSVKVIYTLTKEEKNYPGFEKGRIDENLIKKYVQDLNSSKFFITGPQGMVVSLFETVKNSGVSEDRIFKEDFPGY